MAGPQDCQAEACEIQACLSKNNLNEQKCAKAVEALYRCCDAMYNQAEKEGKEPGSTSCPIRSVVKRKLKSIDQS